ncbi:MAG TPA: hypothetical protein VMJ64_11475 [Anaerolineales bacterium]|nr:hypothetical protein [Anaerolineales bacterium]
MPTKALAIVAAAVSAMLLFTSARGASDDEFKTDHLVVPDQPAADEVLVNESGSGAAPVIMNTNNIEQEQRNTITILPTTMTTSIIKSSGTETINDDSIATVTSTASATVIRGGQQAP